MATRRAVNILSIQDEVIIKTLFLLSFEHKLKKSYTERKVLVIHTLTSNVKCDAVLWCTVC